MFYLALVFEQFWQSFCGSEQLVLPRLPSLIAQMLDRNSLGLPPDFKMPHPALV